MSRCAAGLAAIALLAACGGASEVAPATTAPPATAVPTTSSATTTTTTTTLPPRPKTSDLPTVDDPSADRDAIRVMQRVLAAVCCPMDADGSWGPKTTEAIERLRGFLGLDSGGLDVDLWEAVYRLPAPELYTTVRSPLHPMPLPANAVMLETSAQSRTTEYTLAGDTEPQSLDRWLTETYAGKDFSSWYWCRKSTGDMPTWQWWRKSSGTGGRVMEVTMIDVGEGRVDLRVREVDAPVTNCAGYTPPRTSPPTTVARTAPSSGGGSSGASCTIGMNLEDCEDRLGVGLGQRLRTIDCSGGDRSVFWASNWWIIDAIGGIPVISKSRFGCS